MTLEKNDKTFIDDFVPYMLTLLNDISNKSKSSAKDAITTYANNWRKAQQMTENFVNSLSKEHIKLLVYGITDNNMSKELSKLKTTLSNSVLAAWDKAASKYMRNATQESAKEKKNFINRMTEFDTSMSSIEHTPPSPDE